MRTRAACLLVAAGLAWLGWLGWEAYQRRQFEAWLRWQMADAGMW